MKFTPCNGNCTDQGTHCEGCGRNHEEIAQMRTHVAGLVQLASKMGYENSDHFADCVAVNIKNKLAKML